MLPVELCFEGRFYAGQARVQSVQELRAGQIRYGSHCVDEGQGEKDLSTDLKFLTMATQRAQLRRIHGR